MSHSFGSSSAETLPAPMAPAEVTTVHSPPAVPAPKARGRKKAVLQQFIKFCVVGLSSTVISLLVLYFFKDVVHLRAVLHDALAGSPKIQHTVDANDLYLQVASTFGFIFGVTNGFFWNSRWTFPQVDATKRREQYFKFFAVNIVGLVFNWIVTFLLMQVFKGGTPTHALTWQDDAAIFGAIFVVAFWNFTANKLWTFKH